jgi:putative GTP pyrophosphokinase
MAFDINEEKKVEQLLIKYDFALKMLETELDILIKEYEYKNGYNPVEHIKSRIKSKESATKKLQRKNYDITVDNIIKYVHDMIGIRIVCSFITDVNDIVNTIKKSKHLKIKEEKDYITNPKDTGYTSYHIIVLVPIYLSESTEYVEAEIQIRTIAMDFWATLDHKTRYKFDEMIPEEVQTEMYKCSLDIKSLDTKMQKLNNIMKKYNLD